MGLHIHDFPSVAEMVCIKNEFVQSSKLQCVGHKLGKLKICWKDIWKVPGQVLKKLLGNSVRQHETGGGLVSLSKTKFGSRYVLKVTIGNYEMNYNK